jgi:D-glycero-beta-D-manno-heptose-7-phosphate kinase
MGVPVRAALPPRAAPLSARPPAPTFPGFDAPFHSHGSMPLTSARLEEIVERFGGLRVAVVGDVMLDVYLAGSVSRISPEAPVPVVQVTDEQTALGGAANVVANVIALGAACDVVGCVGRDDAGTVLRRALQTLDGGLVVDRLVETPARPTTTKTRVVARSQQVVRFDRERDDEVDGDVLEAVIAAVAAAVAGADAVVLEDYNKGVLVPRVVRTAIDSAERRRIPVVVDPKFRGFFGYAGATVFKPNAAELESALGEPLRATDDGWLEAARSRVGATHLLLTLGEHGMALKSGGTDALRIPTRAREVFDVSGAGDTVTAFMALGLAAGCDAAEAAQLANLAAGIEVGKPGVAVVTPDELRRAVEEAVRDGH